MNRRIGSLAAAALSLMAAAPAHATTVSNTSGVLEIEAPGYGVNDITITQTPIAYPSAGQILVTDGKDKIFAGVGCQLINYTTVSCPAGGVSSIHADLGDSDDQITNNANKRTELDGGKGDDTLNGGPNDDSMIGGLGADALNGGAGTDTADYRDRKATVGVYMDNGLADDGELGEGDNVRWDVENAYGGKGSDVLWGNALDNGLAGGDGTDVLQGFAGNDTMNGGPRGDTYVGGDGDDYFNNEDGPDGGDDFLGGYGYDSVSYSRRHSVTVSIDGVANDGATYGEGDNVKTDVEYVLGGWHNDVLTGSAAADVLSGADGNDTINGLGGDDRLTGGEDDDTLNGGAGDDTLIGAYRDVTPDGADAFNGGTGSDNVSYAARTARVVVDEDGVADDGEAGEGDNVNADVEYVTGGSGNDSLTGGAGTNHLYGGPGDDDLNGGADADWLFGDAGADDLTGGLGNDRLKGGFGDDDLNGIDGQQHNDTLDGEWNRDSCASDRLDSQTACEDSTQSRL